MFRERKVHCAKEFGISGFVFLLTHRTKHHRVKTFHKAKQKKTEKQKNRQQAVVFSLDVVCRTVFLCFLASRSQDACYCSYFRKTNKKKKKEKKRKQNLHQSREGEREPFPTPGPDLTLVGFVCGGTRIKASPPFLPWLGSRAAKEPLSFNWENQGTGSTDTLQSISRVVLHQLSLSRKAPAKQ